MREHDRECCDGIRELNDAQNVLLKDLKQKLADNVPVIASDFSSPLEEINSSYNRVKLRSAQKSSLAANMLNDLEKFIRKLDSDLAVFENELRGCGEFEQISKGIDPGSEVILFFKYENNNY